MKLYGTTTSPFVRRVRVVARELGETVERIDTSTPEGQARVAEVSPIRKVPVAVVDGRTLFDSRAIIQYLVTTRGYGTLTPPRDPWREGNLLNAIDGALDSIIQVFYLKRDGVTGYENSEFARRQLARTDAIFTWLGTQLAPSGAAFDAGGGLGLVEISVIAALDWMDFRGTYPTESATGLVKLREALRDRPSLVETRPHA